jgi:uncharacterized damage-inducible protein DinB
MNDMNTEELALRYPVGRFNRGTKAGTLERRAACTAFLERWPAQLTTLVTPWSDERLDTPYRPGGWTVRQLVHHIADSHGQSLHRFKLALTEDQPVIKPYKEALWAEHADARTMPIQPSLDIISGTHARWVVLLRAMQAEDFERGFQHPEQNRLIVLDEALELYVWHANHHMAHIQRLAERNGW